MCGQVIRLPQTEKEAWDEEIGVLFQPNARANTIFCVKWAENTLKVAI